MRQRKYYVKVRRIQQFPLAGLQPALAGLSLAFRTVAIATGVIRDGGVSAARAFIDMPAQRGGAAAQNRIQRLQALPVETKPGAVDKGRSGGADYVGHLQRRPAHVELCRLVVTERERVERAGGGLQVTMRKVQVHRRSLQVTMAHQNLDGPQIDASLEQVGGEAVAPIPGPE